MRVFRTAWFWLLALLVTTALAAAPVHRLNAHRSGDRSAHTRRLHRAVRHRARSKPRPHIYMRWRPYGKGRITGTTYVADGIYVPNPDITPSMFRAALQKARAKSHSAADAPVQITAFVHFQQPDNPPAHQTVVFKVYVLNDMHPEDPAQFPSVGGKDTATSYDGQLTISDKIDPDTGFLEETMNVSRHGSKQFVLITAYAGNMLVSQVIKVEA